MRLFFLYLILSLLLFVTACKSNNKTENVIPEDEFIEILTELHIADAILTEKALYDRKLKDSTKSYYNYILVKHHMSRNKFDRSLRYYGQNAEKLTKMYDQVIMNLKQRAQAFNNEKSIFNVPTLILNELNAIDKPERVSINLWTKQLSWKLPEQGKINTIKFERKLSARIVKYHFSADYLIYPDDSSKGLRMLIYLYYKDKSHTTFIDSSFVKDGKWHRHNLIAEPKGKRIPAKIICKLADHRPGTKTKHLEIKDVSLKEEAIIPKKIQIKSKKKSK